MTRDRGVVLVAVLLALTLLAVIVTELAFSARLEASMVRSYRDDVLARHLVEAAVQQALREIATPAQVAAPDEAGQLVFYRALPGQTTPTRLPALPRMRVALGPGEFSYRLADESARLGLNAMGPDRFDRLLEALGLDRSQRDIIGDSLQDWRDPNEAHRLYGAESPFYLALPVPYRARNANLQDAAELLQIRGMTPEVYWGSRDRSGLAELVTAAPVGAVNLNTASPLVLKAVGLSDAEIADVVQTRVRAPYPSVPGRFAGRGLAVGTSVFRVEAEGWVAGAVRNRAVAIVQRGRKNAPLEATILTWRPGGEP